MKNNQYTPTTYSTRTVRFAGLCAIPWLLSGLLGLTPQAHGQDVTKAPVISSFSPASGAVGTEVTINGDNLAEATAVRFNNLTASFHAGISGANLVAIVPVGATSGPITVATPFGLDSTATNFAVTEAPAPAVTGFTPGSGPVGTTVLITGSNFTGVSAVRFGGVEATFTLFGNTLTASVPATASTGPITVVAAGGSASSAQPFVVTSAGALAITAVTPASARPGTLVTIDGQNLKGVTGVFFNGTAATFSLFGTAILATVPDKASTGPITVTSPNASASSPTPFTVVNPLSPEISAFDPPSGAVGATVTLTGTNFVGVTAVSFGGVSAAFIPVSTSQVRAIVPLGAVTGEISLSTGLGTGVSSDIFYVAPVLLSFSPAQGVAGTTVTLNGVNFSGAIAVLFGGVLATFTEVSPTEIAAVVPENAASGSITIATPAGFADSQTPFLLPPAIVQIDPPSALPLTEVTITGANLLDVTGVRFGSVNALFVSKSVTTLIATVPALATAGPVTVITAVGSAVSPEDFYIGQFSDLRVGLTASASTFSVGDFLGYTMSVTNRGPLPATGVVLTDRLPLTTRIVSPPSGAPCVVNNNIITCTLGDLAADATVAIRVSVSVLDGVYLTNEVTVTSTANDPNLGNNVATQVATLKGAPPIPDSSVSLHAELNGTAVQLSWPTGNFILESAPALGVGTVWTEVKDPPVLTNGQSTVLQNTSLGQSFYRLKIP